MPDIAFPLDLIEAQRDWNRARAALVRRPVKTPELLNRLRTLGVRVAVHSFWETEDGKSPSAREDLRQRVSEMEKAEERLTDQQRRILTWVRRWVAEHGEAPTQRQIGQAVGLSRGLADNSEAAGQGLVSVGSGNAPPLFWERVGCPRRSGGSQRVTVGTLVSGAPFNDAALEQQGPHSLTAKREL
ncbi:hypothetical protein AS200_14105 [Streptomyces sp. CdTB01]|nr:hypothetical protein AS200_14105 [Streptomyces sp. CdTB01]